MVAMNMRVHQDPDGRVGERPEGLQRLFGHLPVLRIHHQGSVRSEEHNGSAAGGIGVCLIKGLRTMQHEEIR